MRGEDVGAELYAAGGDAGDDCEYLKAGVAEKDMTGGGCGGLARIKQKGFRLVKGCSDAKG